MCHGIWSPAFKLHWQPEAGPVLSPDIPAPRLQVLASSFAIPWAEGTSHEGMFRTPTRSRRFLTMTWVFSLVPIMAMSVRILFTRLNIQKFKSLYRF